MTMWQILQEDGSKVWVLADDVKQGLHQRAVVLRHGRDRDMLMDYIKPIPVPEYANSVISLYRQEDPGPVQIRIDKHRDTRSGVAKLIEEEQEDSNQLRFLTRWQR